MIRTLSFPGISRTCLAFGIDIATDPIPVRPGAHYMIGGLRSDLDGRTSVPGLFAIGECGSTGFHGANRMGSNSLLEGLVVGARCGAFVDSAQMQRAHWSAPPASPRNGNAVHLNLTDLTYSLKSLMWRAVGVERTAADLENATEQLAFWARVTQDMAPAHRIGWESRNMLLLAQAITLSATARAESRGAHCRTDCPDPINPPRQTDLTISALGPTLATPHKNPQ